MFSGRAHALPMLGVAVLACLGMLVGVPAAQADGLGGKKTTTQSQIDKNSAQTSKDQKTLNQASVALLQAQRALVNAQADLASKQQARQQAQAEDTQLAGLAEQAGRTLAARQADLRTAEQAVADGQAKVAAQHDTIGQVAQAAVQQNSTLLSWSMVLTDFDMSNISDRLQWATQSFASSEHAFDDLVTAQTQLQQAQARAQQAEQSAAAAKTAAAAASQAASDHLVVTKNAEAAAQQAQQSVTTQVAASRSAEARAQAAIKADKTKAAQLKKQLALIEQQIKDSAASVKHVTTVSATPARGGTSAASAQAIAKSLLGNYGFSTSQFGCLVNLWNYESGWRYTARNKSSGAYGIPQSLPASKMASVGPDWLTNPTTQIKWGLGYIKGRYGTPCGAWSHELSHGWY